MTRIPPCPYENARYDAETRQWIEIKIARYLSGVIGFSLLALAGCAALAWVIVNF